MGFNFSKTNINEIEKNQNQNQPIDDNPNLNINGITTSIDPTFKISRNNSLQHNQTNQTIHTNLIKRK